MTLPEPRGGRSGTSQDYAYRRLRHALMVGAIAPGRAVTIRGLAEALHVSPTPIREALRRLSAEHALLVLDNRRIIVSKMEAPRFLALIDLRCAIERHAARQALPYVSDVLIENLTRIDASVNHAIAERNHENHVLLNQDFHLTLHSANPDQVATPMIESLWLQIGPFLRIAAAYVEEYYSVDRHIEILDALRDRDAIALEAAIEADIRDGVGGLDRAALERILGGQAIPPHHPRGSRPDHASLLRI